MPDPAIDPRRFVIALTVLGLITVLVLAEGETGSVLVYCMVAICVFFIAGSPPRLLGPARRLGRSGLCARLRQRSARRPRGRSVHLVPRRRRRPPGAGYNQIQSVTAIGSGGLVGQGIFEGPQTQFGFLPEKQTDFIFAAVGEETGFLRGGDRARSVRAAPAPDTHDGPLHERPIRSTSRRSGSLPWFWCRSCRTSA